MNQIDKISITPTVGNTKELEKELMEGGKAVLEVMYDVLNWFW